MLSSHLTAGLAFKKTKTPHDHEKELRDRTTELIYLSTKLNHAKETCVNLEYERQKFREASRAIKKDNIDQVWIYNGTCFLQTNQSNSLKILESDAKTVEEVKEQITEVIKQDTDTFLRLHKQRNLEERGFGLKPLVRDGKLTE